MEEIQKQLVEFLDKAYELTRVALKQVQARNFEELSEVLDNRERALNIINSLSEKLSLYKDVKSPKTLIEFNN